MKSYLRSNQPGKGTGTNWRGDGAGPFRFLSENWRLPELLRHN